MKKLILNFLTKQVDWKCFVTVSCVCLALSLAAISFTTAIISDSIYPLFMLIPAIAFGAFSASITP